MPRVRKGRKVYNTYSSDVMKDAIKAVKSGQLNTFQASKDYKVPRKSLARHLLKSAIDGENVVTSIGVYGEHTQVFSANQERLLCDRSLLLADRGFPVTVASLRKLAFQYASSLNNLGKLKCKIPVTWVSNNSAGKDWYLGFKARHTELAIRKPEGLSTSRAQAFNKDRINHYFESIIPALKDVDPRVIYNVDETGLTNVPNVPCKVVARKGCRSVSSVQVGERGTLTTILPCVNAAGHLLPPFIIFKGKRMDQRLTQALEENNIRGEMTESGYIDIACFIKFLEHFVKYKEGEKGRKCFLFLDGHSTHNSYEALQFSIDNNIELVCIPPHTSHRLQPLDTHVNMPLKRQWATLVQTYISEHSSVMINRFDFIKLLVKLWPLLESKRGLIVESFQHCGIYPTKNVVNANEFEICNSFTDVSVNSTPALISTRSAAAASILKDVMASPKKLANPTHKKLHIPFVCSKAATLKVKLDFKNKPKSSSPSSSTVFNSTVCLPSTSSGIGLPQPAKKLKITTNPGDSCHCCGLPWKGSMLDFLECIECKEWSCEDCFEVERCSDCVE